MANRPAPALLLRDGDRDQLEGWLRSRSLSSGLAKRARMILLAADGVGNRAIAQRVGASPTTVIEWRTRYDERGLAGLVDRERGQKLHTVPHGDTRLGDGATVVPRWHPKDPNNRAAERMPPKRPP